MNILSKLAFNSEKPAVLSVKEDGTVHLMAIGLLKGQMLNKHKTAVPALLTVLQGKLRFELPDEQLILNCYDTFQIPVDVLHEVHGLEEQNAFTLLKEKK